MIETAVVPMTALSTDLAGRCPQSAWKSADYPGQGTSPLLIVPLLFHGLSRGIAPPNVRNGPSSAF